MDIRRPWYAATSQKNPYKDPTSVQGVRAGTIPQLLQQATCPNIIAALSSSPFPAFLPFLLPTFLPPSSPFLRGCFFVSG